MEVQPMVLAALVSEGMGGTGKWPMTSHPGPRGERLVLLFQHCGLVFPLTDYSAVITVSLDYY